MEGKSSEEGGVKGLVDDRPRQFIAVRQRQTLVGPRLLQVCQMGGFWVQKGVLLLSVAAYKSRSLAPGQRLQFRGTLEMRVYRNDLKI